MQVEETLWGPEKKADMRIEGGETLKTFQMPAHAERVQYILKAPSNRPVRAKVELWIGPIRCVHELIYNCMDGDAFPLRVSLQFKKVRPVLKVSTDSTFEFPLQCGVFVPTPEESARIGETTKAMFYNAPMKHKVQGGSTIDNKGGAIRTFNVEQSWEKTQLMVWSKDVGKKSFKSNIEILQGPNNAKQFLNLRCGGSTQPFHCVMQLEEVPRGRPLRDRVRALRQAQREQPCRLGRRRLRRLLSGKREKETTWRSVRQQHLRNAIRNNRGIRGRPGALDPRQACQIKSIVLEEISRPAYM
jgi:hypothetical protein